MVLIILQDKDSYQTIFAQEDGSLAAPTASLHFSNQLVSRLDKKKVEFSFVTLHPKIHICLEFFFRPGKLQQK